MRTPPPFRSLPNPKEVWAWGMFDLANQSFTLLIITLLFPIYFKEVAIGDPAKGDALWSAGVSVALFLVVALSPIVGSFADMHSCRKRFLMVSGIGCAALTMALALIEPGSGWIGLLIFIPANILYQLGENMLASFLPGLSTTRTIGKVSAIGWTMGYIGGLALLILVVLLAKFAGWGDPTSWRPFFIIAAVWFVMGMIPSAMILREPSTHQLDPSTRVGVFARLKATVNRAMGHRQLRLFLVAFLIYGFGVQTMIAFAAILAGDFGIVGQDLIVFSLQLTVTAGATAALVAKFQDRIGVKPTIIGFLGVWMLSCGSMFVVKVFVPNDPPAWIFWVIGNGIGIGLGGIGTSSRVIVGMFSPKERTAEFFGLWGMTYKLAGAIGVLAFGQIKAWIGDTTALGVLTGFFVVGAMLMLRVDVLQGVRDARRADRLTGSG
tara:strand:+ start:80687 stop:81994 length:1308 start_codon:yes stop_codon:yes gene_type:complete